MRRRDLFAAGAAALAGAAACTTRNASAGEGAQRLPVAKLQEWEALGYGMFLHFGISTYDGKEWSDGKTPASEYRPDKLDVDQWMEVARDAGMKYAILTTKHVAGFCLWPSKYTDYSVSNSPVKTDVVGEFVKACDRRGVKPGFYYCSFDNHHTFGSVTVDHCGAPFDTVDQVQQIERSGKAFTTSTYQAFQRQQVTELLTSYGKIAEFWLDEPGVLGRGYRTYLYHHVTSLQPDCVLLANGSYGDTEHWDPWYTWPQDIIGYEVPTDASMPAMKEHIHWRTVEGKRYYLPGEVYDLIGRHWFWMDGDQPRPDDKLAKLYRDSRGNGTSLLLDVPPDKHGRIPEIYVAALQRLRKNVVI